jgi:hypothetical protein
VADAALVPAAVRPAMNAVSISPTPPGVIGT